MRAHLRLPLLPYHHLTAGVSLSSSGHPAMNQGDAVACYEGLSGLIRTSCVGQRCLVWQMKDLSGDNLKLGQKAQQHHQYSENYLYKRLHPEFSRAETEIRVLGRNAFHRSCLPSSRGYDTKVPHPQPWIQSCTKSIEPQTITSTHWNLHSFLPCAWSQLICASHSRRPTPMPM